MVSPISSIAAGINAQAQAQSDAVEEAAKKLLQLMEKLKEAEAKGDTTEAAQLQAQLTTSQYDQKC